MMGMISTPEMIKELVENPGKQFEGEVNSWRCVASVDESGEIVCIERLTGEKVNLLRAQALSALWKEIETPVSWKDAIRAWINGRNIRIEMPGDNHGQDSRRIICVQPQTQVLGRYKKWPNGTWETGFTRDHFTKGEWYIEG